MTRLLLAAAVAAAAFVGAAPATAAPECTLYTCCVPDETGLCWDVACVCPYDGCWCLPGATH